MNNLPPIQDALSAFLDDMTPLLGLDGSRRCILRGAIVETFQPYVERAKIEKLKIELDKATEKA